MVAACRSVREFLCELVISRALAPESSFEPDNLARESASPRLRCNRGFNASCNAAERSPGTVELSCLCLAPTTQPRWRRSDNSMLTACNELTTSLSGLQCCQCVVAIVAMSAFSPVNAWRVKRNVRRSASMARLNGP